MTSQGLENSRTNGRWTNQEHQKFILGLQLYGKDWKKIQTLIGTRNGAQIRSHAQKFFIKIKRQFENTDLNDNWQQTKESPLENISSLVQSNPQSQTREEYSYYLNKIIQRDAFNKTFDFWASLVDHKSLIDFEIEVRQKRKNSFVRITEENSEGLEPSKKIKYQ